MKKYVITEEIKTFIDKNPEAIAFLYEFGEPTGSRGTKGHGNPGCVSVIVANPEFKTRNSPHVMVLCVDVRRDYGAIRGHYAKALAEAQKTVAEIQKEIALYKQAKILEEIH